MPNSSQSQSKLEKEIRELFKLAQDVEDESAFLQEPSYKTFKAKYDGGQSEILELFFNFMTIKFYNVCIYWSYKYLNNRVCSYPGRWSALRALVTSYSGLKNHEKVLEIGLEWLSLHQRTPRVNEDTEDEVMSKFLKEIRESAVALNKYDEAEKYSREELKLEVKFYNQSKVDRSTLLYCYLNLIDAQMKNKNFNGALKTFKHIKILNIHSLDPKDVRTALEQDESINKFPGLYPGFYLKNELLPNPEFVTDLIKDHYIEYRFNEARNKESNKVTDLCFVVSQLICKKSELLNVVYNKHGQKWYELYLDILCNISMHLKTLYTSYLVISSELHENPTTYCKIDISNHKPNFFDITYELIAGGLKFAEKNLSVRRKWLLRLSGSILGYQAVGPTYFVTKAMKKYEIPIPHVMPFIGMFIKGRNNLQEEDYKDMLLLKNSLIIMNHFKKLLT